MDALCHGRQLVLRQREDCRDRLQLGDDNDTVSIARLHVIAGIHLAQPDPAADRRDDPAVGQVQFLCIDLRLIGLHGAAVLLDQRGLSVERLARDRVLCHQRLVTSQIDLGVLEHRLILGELSFRLSQRNLIRPRVDLREEIALVDHLAFLEGALDQLAVDLRLDRDHGQRRHRTEPAQHDRHVALLDRGSTDRHRAAGLEPPGLRRLWAGAENQPENQRGADQQKDSVTQ